MYVLVLYQLSMERLTNLMVVQFGGNVFYYYYYVIRM
jgi:hypothetical protein